MYFNKYVRFISSKNRSSAIRVASLYRKAWGRDLENDGFSQGSCDYTILSDFPATKRGFSCLSEQFASHMFRQDRMYNDVVGGLLDFFYKKAVDDPSKNAGILTGLASNDKAKLAQAGNRASALLKSDRRMFSRLMSRLHQRALPDFLLEVKKYLTDGDGYFLFDSHPEMAKISQNTRKEMDKVTNQNTKFKKKLKGVEAKIKLLKRLTSFTVHDDDKDKVLEKYFIQHGKMLGQLMKMLPKSKIYFKEDANLVKGISRSRTRSLDDNPLSWVDAVRSAFESTDSLKRALRGNIISAFEYGEGFTQRTIDIIARDMIPSFRRSAQYEEWIERLLAKDGGLEILEQAISLYLTPILEDMDEFQVQDMINDERSDFLDSYN